MQITPGSGSGGLGSITVARTEVALSGLSNYDLTIPAGCYKIEVALAGIGTNGTTGCTFQLGDAGGIEATGYLMTNSSNGTWANQTTAFEWTNMDGTMVVHGDAELRLIDDALFMWSYSGRAGRSSSAVLNVGAGSKATSAATTTLRFGCGANAFDAGAYITFTTYVLNT